MKVRQDYSEGDRVSVDWFQNGQSSKAGFVLNADKTKGITVISDTGEVALFHESNFCPKELDAPGFLAAARLGVMKAVKRYIEMGSSEKMYDWINAKDPVSGQTALHQACAFGKVDVIETLLKNGASVSLKDSAALSPLDVAVSKGQTGVVSRMLTERVKRQEDRVDLFLDCFCTVVPDISLENILLLTCKDFLEFQKIPSYDVCKTSNKHISAKSVPKNASILLISHRWASENSPDPSDFHYIMIKEYLSRGSTPWEYIWIDFACVTQQKGALRDSQIKNLPLIMILSSRCLALSSMILAGSQGRGNAASVAADLLGGLVSNLKDYVERSWCTAEILCCSLLGCPIDIAFSVEGYMLEFVPHPGPGWYEDSDKLIGISMQLGGFQRAALGAATRFPLKKLQDSEYVHREGSADFRSVWQNLLRDWWWIDQDASLSDPADHLKSFMECLVLLRQDEILIAKASSYSLTLEDMLALKISGSNFKDYSRKLGNVCQEDDRLFLVQMVFLVLVFCLDDVPAYFKPPKKVHLEEAPNMSNINSTPCPPVIVQTVEPTLAPLAPPASSCCKCACKCTIS